MPSAAELEQLDWACGINYNPFKPKPRSPIGFYRDKDTYFDAGDPESLRKAIKDAAERGITKFIG